MSMLSPHLGDQVSLWDNIQTELAAIQTSSPGQCGAGSSGASGAGSSGASGAGPSSQSGAGHSSQSESGTGSSSHSRASSSSDRARLPPHSNRKRAHEETLTPGTAAANNKILCLSNAKFVLDLDLRAVLMKDDSAKCIVESYENDTDDDDPDAEKTLSETQRNLIVRLIIKHILANTRDFNYKLLEDVARKITQVFPNECEKIYFIAPKTEGHTQSTPKGKLYKRLRNQLTFNNSLTSRSNQKQNTLNETEQTRHGSNFQTIVDQGVTPETTAAALWLDSNRHPWVTVLQKWEITAPIRFKELFYDFEDNSFINNYIEKWPVLQHKSGYELIIADFQLLFPAAVESLLERWGEFSRATITLARKDVKDSTGKGYLKSHSLCMDNNPRGKACFLLSLLPSIRPNRRILDIGTGKTVKVSTATARDSFFLHLTVANGLKQAIQDRRNSFMDAESRGRPLIVIVGPELTKVQSVYVSVASLLFSVPCVVTALDVAFKSFFAFHLKYPPESAHIWMTLQRAVYKLRTEWDKEGDISHYWVNYYKTIL